MESSAKSATQKYYVSTFYNFQHIENPEQVKAELKDHFNKTRIKGLMILGHEGFNTTMCALSAESLEALKKYIIEYFKCPGILFKDSESHIEPFKRLSIKIRNEIVTLGTPELVPVSREHSHLSPQQWNDVLQKEKDFLLIDTRNWYETEIGTFKGAVNPGIDVFTDFPKFIEEKNISKDKKMLIFCTGGIRCEKGILELEKQGFNNVFQLEGGILNYLEQFPNSEYEGECFVFDHRVALDQNLQPSQVFKLCPHCGQPGTLKID
jgi:UPF0176 protein